MKKRLTLLVAFITLTAFTTVTKNDDFNFVGKWIGKDEKGAKGGFIFDKEGYVTFIKGEETMGGKEFSLKGKKINLKYSIDQTATPIKLDIIMEEIESGKSRKLLLIAKIMAKDKIMLAQEGEGKRPTTFTKNNSITLTREE
ncbi:hypothetical protein [Flavobacterium sp.]|uniref:hypothetical protein n=1 Tax=Flavobacterium sp. TaxID=239 RepID=UPI002FD92E4B